MILIGFGLAAASAFSGAALYINWAEQPARMKLDDVALLTEWKPSYARGFQMQASLAILAGVLGFAAFYFEHSFLALLGGLVMFPTGPLLCLA